MGGGVIANTIFVFDKLVCDVKISKPNKMPNSEIILPYVFVGVEAFGLRCDFLKHYPRDNLNKDTRIFNYRLSRNRRIVKNTFGIMAS